MHLKMYKKISAELKKDFFTVLSGFFVSFVGFLLISLWRIFDTETLLIVQIFCVSVIFYFLMIVHETFWQKSYSYQNKLVTTLLVFIVLSFLLLNIDRSRSVYILKWVSQTSVSTGYTDISLISEIYNLQLSEVAEYE